MKTKKVKVTRYQTKRTSEEVEEEWIDREYYINKLMDKQKKTGELIIEIRGGLLAEVHNAPNKEYLLIDWDVIEGDCAMTDEEFKKEFIDYFNLEDENDSI